MSLVFERWYPVFFGLCAALFAALLDARLPTDSSYLAGLLSASISASAILIGFIATAKSILIALPSSFRKELHDSGYMEDLARYLNEAMSSNIIFCMLNIFGFFPIFQLNVQYLSPIWIGTGVYCFAVFWRVGSIMVAVLKKQ